MHVDTRLRRIDFYAVFSACTRGAPFARRAGQLTDTEAEAMHRTLVAAAHAVLVVALSVTSATSSAAQTAAPSPIRNSAPEFLFSAPRGTVGVRASFLAAREGGDLFAFVRKELTIDKGDFNSPGATIEFSFVVTPRLSVVGDVDLTRSRVDSESRPFKGSDGLPIAQISRLTQSNFAGGLKFALLPLGQRISRYAWIPRTIVPYVSVGAGAMYHQFSQEGEFVDYVDLSIFRANLETSGWAPSVHVAFGADVRVWGRVYLDFEGKYIVAHDSLQPDFAGFDGIDLAGFRFGTGMHVAF